MGVPKTIDNDLMVTDHTPGYGSAAKYIALVMKELVRDATVYDVDSVTVVEIMGRNAGWLTAAAALAKAEDCEGADMICMPEIPFGVDQFIEKVARMQSQKRALLIAVSEDVYKRQMLVLTSLITRAFSFKGRRRCHSMAFTYRLMGGRNCTSRLSV